MSQIDNPPPGEAFELAMASMRQRRWIEASTLWQVFRSRYEGHPAPWLQGAISYLRQGLYAEADELLRYAQIHFAKHVGTWLSSAELARLQGDDERELEILTAGREVLPGSWQLVCLEADLEERRGDSENAQRLNQLACEMAPEQIEPLVQAAEMSAKRLDWVEATSHWGKVLKLRPAYSDGYSQLAKIYRAWGNPGLARKYRLAAQYGPEMLESEGVETEHKPRNTQQDLKSRLLHFFSLILTKSLFNLKSETSRTYLSYAWVLVEPLLHLTIYYFLFDKLLHSGVENYALFLLCGLTPWMWFSKSVTTSAGSIIGGQGLMLNSNVSPAFFPLVAVVQSALKQLPALTLLLLLGVATDPATLSWALLYLPIVVLVQFAFTVVSCMLVAAAVSIVRDLGNLVGTGLMLLMFMSGVIYQYQMLPHAIRQLVEFNPLTLIVTAYRDVIISGVAPDACDMLYVSAAVVLLGGLNVAIYKHQRHNFVRRGMV